MATRTLMPAGGQRTGEVFDFGAAAARELGRRDENVQLAKRPLREYVELVPEPNIGLLRIEDDFPFQQGWYAPEVVDAEEVVMRKSTQIGATAYWWRWAVRRTDQFGETGIYIFPTDTHVTEFGDERIEPAIEESDYLRSRIPRGYVRHKRLKRIGRGFLHLRGSNSKAGAQSVAAQFVVFDEYDFLDPKNLPQIERRISGARQLGKTPRIRRLGTPTLDGYGISEAYEATDKRVWHVTCGHCGYEQPVTWEDNVRWRNDPDGEVMRAGNDTFEDRKYVAEVWRACIRCDDELDVRRGRWIATAPERRVIGFDVPRLIVPMTDLRQIVVASRSTKPGEVEAFQNNDLGRPYSETGAQLTQKDLLRASERGVEMVEAYSGPNPTTAGIDVAGERDLNMVIHEQLPAQHPGEPNPRRALWVGTVKSFEEAAAKIRAFRCAQVAVDSNPERRYGRALAAAFPPGLVVLVVYNWNNDSDAIKVSEIGPPGTPVEGIPFKVTVNRTEAIDAMMDGIRQLRNAPPRNPPHGYYEQMRALKRKTELDKKERPVRVYVTTGSAGDDYAHAEVFGVVATELLRMGHGVRAIQAQVAGRPLSEEEIGFQRVRLTGHDVDQYNPGFGGEE
jgi:hypothetical protein